MTRADDWLNANKFSLNIDETNCRLTTHNRYDRMTYLVIHIKIRDRKLTRVTSTKFSGLTIGERHNYREKLDASL